MSMNGDAFKKTIVLIFAIISLLSTLLLIVVGVLYAFEGGVKDYSPEENAAAAMMMGVCSTPLGIITGILFFVYFRIGRREKIENDIVAFLKLYRRVTLPTLASSLNMKVKDAEKILLDVISKGKIKAYMDRNTKEIFIEEAISAARVENTHCPNCGAVRTGVFMIGEAVKCKYCGTVFKVEK